MKTSTRVTSFDPPDEREPGDQYVIVRSLPKYVFLYPTFFAAIAMTVATTWLPEHTVTGTLIFLAILSLNLLALAMDFRSAQVIGLVGFGFGVALGLILIDLHVTSILPRVLALGRQVTPEANAQFYGTLAVMMGLIYVLVYFVDVRNCYWRICPDTMEHYHGFFKERVTTYPAPGNLMQKDITDMFEYALLRSGRLTIHPVNGEDIILDNVPRINRVEARLQTMLHRRGAEHAHRGRRGR